MADSDAVDSGDVEVDVSDASPLTPDEPDEYDEESEVEEAAPQMYVLPAPDVQTFVKFLGHSDNKFVAGEEVTALIGMTNAGDNTYNVSWGQNAKQASVSGSKATNGRERSLDQPLNNLLAFSLSLFFTASPVSSLLHSVGAHLHSPYDMNFFIQNFTVRWTSNLLPPRSEVTVEYRFVPNERLEPLDFHMSGWLIYNDTKPTPIIYR